MEKKRSKSAKLPLWLVLVIAVIMLSLKLIPESVWNSAYEKTGVNETLSLTSDVSVHFVDVGQGDCTVIQSKDGVILIDSGEEDKAQTVINYLGKIGVEKLDYCIVTHPHSDHMGSMAQVLSVYQADKLIMPELTDINTPTTKIYENFLLSAEENATEVIPAEAGYTYSLGEIEMSVLGPCEQDEDLNNMSAVIKVEYGSTSFLITGDCSFSEEEDIMDNYYNELSSDVLKVGHHGSSGATSVDWLEAVEPEYSVISVGADNSYGHPTKRVLEDIEDFGSKIYTTENEGTIIFDTDGKTIVKR